MRINYIKLENFLGIYAGMNKKSVEIDFSNNKNKIIILNAGNGKGKTTLLSMLHPLRETFDARKDIVIPKELGHKIVDLTHNGIDYHIEHFYGKKNKSFITKNGKELNENGNIKSFNEIAKNELGIDEEYFKIGKIGSNVSNFIDLKVPDRKKYITEFIPSIDEYLKAYDVIKEKYTFYNTQIKLIKNTIEKYSGLKDIDELKLYVKQLLDQLNDRQNELAKINLKIDGLSENKKKIEDSIIEYINEKTEYTINNFETDINGITLYIDNDLNELETNLDYYINLNNNFINKYKIHKESNIYEYIKELENKFTTRKIKIEENLNNLEELSKKLESEIINAKNKIEYYNNKLSEVNTELTSEQIEEFQNIVNNSEIEIKLAKTNLLANESKLTNDEIDITTSFYENNVSVNPCILQTIIKEAIDNYENIKANYSLEILNGFYEYKKSNNDIKNTYILTELNNKNNELNEINKSINELQNSINMAETILPKRPKECINDKCSFIEHALDIKNNYVPELEIKLAKKEELEDIVKELEDTRIKIDSYIEINKSLKLSNNYVNSHFPEFISDKIINRNILITDNTRLSEELKIKNIENIFNFRKEIDILNRRITEYKSIIDSFNISESLIEEYNNQLKEYNSIIFNNTNQIKEINDKINDLNLKLDDSEKRIIICNEYYDIYNNLNEYDSMYNNLLTHQKEIFKLLNEYNNFKLENNIDELNERHNLLNNMIKEINSKLQENKTAITIIEDNMNKLNEIEIIYKDVILIKDALDPKKGIPIVFSDEYLKNISTITNRLLKIAYNDHFKIRFKLTATDFLIEVYKSDGTFLNDIKEASQGESSLTNLSLSLAMLEFMIKNYNIIYLDEVDCTLSTENRKLFIEMLENQMDSLNIEQCFVITHNNEFYDKNVDLILLEDHDCPITDEYFMNGKNIIFKI